MIECASTIAEVCVYPGQVRIVRRGHLELPAGPAEVILPNLPLSLMPETVRVAGRGTAPVRLLGVEVNMARHAIPPEEALVEMDAQIERLEDKDRALAGRIEALNHRLETLAALAQSSAERLPRGFARGKVDVSGVESLLSFVHKGEEGTREQVRQMEVKRRDLGRELDRLRRLREERQQPGSPDRYAVRVPVEAEKAGDLQIEVTYVCRDATWAPLYDLRLDEKAEGGPRIAVGQLAEVSQQTGEDWTGVALSVSTARPALAASLPELEPWYIRLYRPELAKRRGLPMAAMPAPGGFAEGAAEDLERLSDEMRAMAPPPAPVPVQATVAVAEVRREGPAVVFVAPGVTTLPADGSPHKVFLGTQDLPAPLDWVTAPKIEAHVYRRARVENSSPAILLPGSASLFYGDTFIGTTSVPETPPQAEFEVYLGVDDQVKVERELVDRTVDKSGLLEKIRRMLFSYQIKLHNYHPERIALTVLDQIPVSRDESLKVKLLRGDLPVEPGDLGELRWELALASGEERTISFAFQVDMPLEGEAVGLP